ncbi:DUF317 domain-containing protein [Streptomyces althioticus]|uniref:DUF317 domain-containing protein n=1 Tax=Streptomyces althioticus TaxID=83380 RepID=UPI0037CD60B3
MYLAGSNGTGEAGFAPVAHWPHHYLDEGPCQFLVTSPDQRIRIGWFGDDFELWRISAASKAASATRWTATVNHVTSAEIVAGLTTALAHDYAETDAYDSNGRFLAHPSIHWADAVRPLTDAGWTRGVPGSPGTIEIVAPDGPSRIRPVACSHAHRSRAAQRSGSEKQVEASCASIRPSSRFMISTADQGAAPEAQHRVRI